MPKPTPLPVSPDDLPFLAKQVITESKFPMLATVDRGQPRVRPVSPVKVDGMTVYIANLRSYDKTAQIENNRKVELCYLSPSHDQLRITGEAHVVTDRMVLEDIWAANRLLAHYLGTIDNPEFMVYRIDPVQVRFMREWALEYWEVPLENK
jgi:general stress protein 26